MRLNVWPTRLTLIALAACLAVAWTCPVQAEGRVTLIDVGQGDAIWVHDDSGFDALIDAGPPESAEMLLRQLSGVPDLDVLMWTHTHEDHIGGMPAVLRAIPVRQVLWTGLTYPTNTFSQTLHLIGANEIPEDTVREGDVLTWGSFEVLVLHPDRVYPKTNDCSIVLKLSYGGTDLLLAGDAEWDAEQAMIAGGYDLECDILKVGHHGGDTSTRPEWLDAVQPDKALISVARFNDYGYPSLPVVERLRSRSIDTYRTDRHGTVVVLLDGDGYRIVTERTSVALPMVWRGIP